MVHLLNLRKGLRSLVCFILFQEGRGMEGAIFFWKDHSIHLKGGFHMEDAHRSLNIKIQQFLDDRVF